MSSLFLLIPIAIVFVIIAVALFFWAIRSDQYEDLDREGYNILFDDDKPKASQAQPKPENNKDDN